MAGEAKVKNSPKGLFLGLVEHPETPETPKKPFICLVWPGLNVSYYLQEPEKDKIH